MSGRDVPKTNFVGKLQELCQQVHCQMPEYYEPNSFETGSIFRFACRLKDWVTYGVSNSKKFAKQIAAREMLDKIKDDKLFMDLSDSSRNVTLQKTSVSKLYEYCEKEKKGVPLYAELPSKDDYFFISCTMDSFTAVGKGKSKKDARENAAFQVAKQFGVHEYWDRLVKLKNEMKDNVSPISELFAVCQKRQLAAPKFSEQQLTEADGIKFKVTCCVHDLTMESDYVPSKKAAKAEAAALVLKLLQVETPQPPPVEISSNLSPKRKIAEASPDEPQEEKRLHLEVEDVVE